MICCAYLDVECKRPPTGKQFGFATHLPYSGHITCHLSSGHDELSVDPEAIFEPSASRSNSSASSLSHLSAMSSSFVKISSFITLNFFSTSARKSSIASESWVAALLLMLLELPPEDGAWAAAADATSKDDTVLTFSVDMLLSGQGLNSVQSLSIVAVQVKLRVLLSKVHSPIESYAKARTKCDVPKKK